MADVRAVQKSVNQTFRDHFGATPLTCRLEDIDRECRELLRYTDLANLKEETGDLLASVLQLCNEAGWDAQELLYGTLNKIEKRSLQYKTLGRKTRVVILGGAFNPIHLGHIKLAQLVLKVTRQDEAWLAPCFKHMAGKDMAPAGHRLEMVRLACQEDMRLKPFDYEIRHELQGETYHFVNRLKKDQDYDNYQFSFVISQDNADQFHGWYRSEELERLIPFIVSPRQGYNKNPKVDWYLKPPHAYIVGEEPLPNVSSSEIRRLLGLTPWATPDVQSALNPLVLNYIVEHGLYGVKGRK